MCRNKQLPGARPLQAAGSRPLANISRLLRDLRAIPGVKKVFVRSGHAVSTISCSRTRDVAFLSELVEHHVSGQLKVAPEHCVADVLDYMGKPHIDVL